MSIAIVIPTFNTQAALDRVISEIPEELWPVVADSILSHLRNSSLGGDYGSERSTSTT